MDEPTPALAELMAEAADLRAAGASWETVATRVRRSAQVCKRWPELYPELWSRLLTEARRHLRENVAGEAITVLRQLLRSEKEPIRRDAAKLLLGATPKAPAKSEIDFQAFVDELAPALKAIDDCSPA